MDTAPAVSATGISFRRLGPDLCDITLRGRHVGTLSRVPDLDAGQRRHLLLVSLFFDPEAPRRYSTIERPRQAIAGILNELSSGPAPPPPYLQHYICEHRRGPDERNSHPIRSDRFLDRNKADAWFECSRPACGPGSTSCSGWAAPPSGSLTPARPRPDSAYRLPSRPFRRRSFPLKSRRRRRALLMRTFTAIIERCPVTGQYVGHVPALPGAHTHADTLDRLHHNLVEVVTLVLEDEDREPETEFIGTHTVHV